MNLDNRSLEKKNEYLNKQLENLNDVNFILKEKNKKFCEDNNLLRERINVFEKYFCFTLVGIVYLQKNT
jgi:hypothetical protein